MKSRLYYENEFVEDFPTALPNWSQYLHSNWGLMVYNNGYLCLHNSDSSKRWLRLDGTPVRLADVPKELLLLEILLK